jgi:hypothetical protein
MKNLILGVGVLALMGVGVACDGFARDRGGSGGSHYTRGYTTDRGTYVAPHYSTNPNGTKLDNWSTKGNVNPYTGKVGTRNY